MYELLDKNKVSYKVNNMEQLASKVGILIKKNKGSKNLEDKINKLGKRILKKTLFEFKSYLNKIWNLTNLNFGMFQKYLFGQ